MYNSNVNQRVSSDIIGQVSSYFKITEESLDIGDTNKRYVPIEENAYACDPGFSLPNSTTFILTPTADNMADWSNAFLTLEIDGTVSIDKKLTIPTNEGNPGLIWVGVKDAMDFIETYQILSNGVSILLQDQAIRESFITSCGISESTRKSDYYSGVRHSDIWKRNYATCCGCEVDFSDGSTTKPFNIKAKIDLRRFLPLSNIKFMPMFAGKLELKVKVSTIGMVSALSDPQLTVFGGNPKRISAIDIPRITNEFVPIGENFRMISETVVVSDADKTIKEMKYGDRYLTIDRDTKCNKCFSTVYNFGLDDRIYQNLVQRYTQMDLTFPTQRLIINTLNNTLCKKSNGTLTLSHTPRFVDSIFLLFPLKTNYLTVYKNPCFESFQIACGGYGAIPGTAMQTYDDNRAIEYLQNAMNVNTDQSGLRKEVAQSLINVDQTLTIGRRSKDCTNFLLGFATEPDNCFQQGQTSNTPINYTIHIKQDTTIEDSYANTTNASPCIAFLTDHTFSIQCRPNNQQPVVKFEAEDITSPEA